MKFVAKKDDAVSPVIGTILLVAITVVLVAIVAAVVMGMVSGVGDSKTVGATVSSVDGFVIGTITGGQDVAKLTSFNVTVTGNKTGSSYLNGTGSALVGVPLKVGEGRMEKEGDSGAKFTESGKYRVTITGKFSDDASQVLYTGSVDITAKPTK